ncbi:MAG: hypothetical protein ACK4HV_01500, partial [Parachlamydiaceae bacterium]
MKPFTRLFFFFFVVYGNLFANLHEESNKVYIQTGKVFIHENKIYVDHNSLALQVEALYSDDNGIYIYLGGRDR